MGIVHQKRNAARPARGRERRDIEQAAVIVGTCHIAGVQRRLVAVQYVEEILWHGPARLQPQQRHCMHGSPVGVAPAEHGHALQRAGQPQHRLDAQGTPARGKERARRAEQPCRRGLRLRDRPGRVKEAVRVRQLCEIEVQKILRQSARRTFVARRMKGRASKRPVMLQGGIKRGWRHPNSPFREIHSKKPLLFAGSGPFLKNAAHEISFLHRPAVRNGPKPQPDRSRRWRSAAGRFHR